MKRIVLVSLVLVVVLFLARNLIAQAVVSQAVRVITGLSVQIQSMEVGIARPVVGAQGVKLFNPLRYPDRTMIDLPELFIHYDLKGFFRGKVHLPEVKIHLNEFVVVKNQSGELNLNSIRGIQAAAEKKQGKPTPAQGPSSLQIDLLELKIGKVIYKDYSAGAPPKVKEFIIGIDERYQNITNPAALGTLIVSRALVHTTIASLANIDLGALQSDLTGTAKEATQGAVQAAGKTLEQATETLKTLFPFEKKEQ